MNLFEKPRKTISSESNAPDNKEDELKRIINDAAKDLGNEPPTSGGSEITRTSKITPSP